MRDLRSELARDRCWDSQTQAIYAACGEPVDDTILQNREELLGLCEFIEAHQVRSYLEVGAWTGRLASVLHRLFHFDRVAACDDGWARRFGLDLHLPPDAAFFQGSSRSEQYRQWRADLGPIDLVLIDADHHYAGVKRDFEINRAFPHRFLALHDITGANRHTVGVRRLWEELSGNKLEIVRPHVELGLEKSVMGIGIWWA